MADQFDASLEWYPSKGGLLHVAAFYKKFHNYIANLADGVSYTLPTVVAGALLATGMVSSANAGLTRAGQAAVGHTGPAVRSNSGC